VVAGIDRDSLTVMKEGEAEELRLHGTDCPKKNE
jgi:endonuclease YncB( thermonuclease family)